MEIQLTWAQIKVFISSKKLSLQYIDYPKMYRVWLQENNVFYMTEINIETPVISGSDQEDFELNYKATANVPIVPIDEDGKSYVRAESRPLDMTTYFTMAGDKIGTPQDIGEGSEIKWDFSNAVNDITPPSGFKKKRIEFQFIDGIRLKEGTMYFYNSPEGAYLDLQVVCPAGQYYLDNNDSPILASVDTVIDRFVNKYFISGNCPMGDELNTEAASAEIPSTYKFWLDVTTINTDIVSYGHVSVEVYRRRTRIL
ncbi:MAG TPA: hypothetical protein ENI61_06665 [Ignavibacteria bacterium]|nr:hypothetical protein [Ignavibacteria bacterium]